MDVINILCVGDIIGKPGRTVLKEVFPQIKKEENIDFSIINVENSASGFGVTEKILNEFNSLEINACTSGNHIYDKKEILKNFDSFTNLIRPYNYPPGNPGQGYRIFEVNQIKIAVVNLIGRVFMPLYDCPFQAFDKVYRELKQETDIIIVDFHAEATSEKQAMGWYVSGKASALCGTHTHVMTADEQILNKETGYITDLGMVGSRNSIIGDKKESIIHKFLTSMPTRFIPSDEPPFVFCAAVFSINTRNGACICVKRILKVIENNF